MKIVLRTRALLSLLLVSAATSTFPSATAARLPSPSALAAANRAAGVAFVHRDSSSSVPPSTRLSASSTSTSTSSMPTPAQKRALLACPSLPLSDGTAHPAIGFGTYKVGFVPASASSAVASGGVSEASQRTAEECVRDALDAGYRFLECAEFYGNEAEVGKAIAASGLKREELFLCSKVWTTTIEKGDEAIRARLEKTLADLGTDYVDLYLVHWPVPGHHVAAYKTLERLKAEGKIRNVGVSNYAVEDCEELLDAGCSPPAVNQIEINPFLYRRNTIDYFQSRGVLLQSYRSLRDGKAMDDPVLARIGAAHSKSPAQVLGRWCVQHGFVYMPKSVKAARMVENGEVFDFELSKQEMEELDGLTTPEALDKFGGLYRKCVNRDTTKDGTLEGVKMDITID